MVDGSRLGEESTWKLVMLLGRAHAAKEWLPAFPDRQEEMRPLGSGFAGAIIVGELAMSLETTSEHIQGMPKYLKKIVRLLQVGCLRARARLAS